ncbi:pilus assembly protein [Nocardioides sp. KIGAM211]|uniref:Pilus assembly protein n=1 Tax=Nocardioides luti TaxID=2761101 RepID=A0A7X0RDZ7_9ACTN|nr:TadE/TadG family type IV pilus assembly protein [Nocardioides luti]MBB6626553.1 pilus assembly protein [Nocardioides luti]
MTRPARRRQRDDRGATAIFVAILSVVLLSCAALSVDLGNAWARKRAVQKQADISALSAGYLLPQTAANKQLIADRVALFLGDNAVTGQAAITGSQLINGITTDGEVTFTKADGSACTTGCVRMTVLAPAARVDFGLAQVTGNDHTDVQRSATVQVQSSLPPREKMIPFWLPSGCGYGAADADTTGGAAAPAPVVSTSSTPTPTATATATATGTASSTTSTSPSPTPTATPTYAFTPSPSQAGNHVLGGTSPLSVLQNGTTTVSNYTVTNIPNNTDRASLRFYSPSGAFFVDYAAQALQKGQGYLNVPAFPVSTEVSATPGDWRVYALIQNNSVVRYSSNYLTFRVTATPAPSSSAPATSAAPTSAAPTAASSSASPTDIPVGCVGQDRGNFGQLDSPRADGSSTQRRLARNIAGGIDHQLAPFVFAPSQTPSKDCGTTQHGFLAGAQPDIVSSSDPPRNCIVGDTGNDGPALYDGLLTGADNGEAGRLAASRGTTRCAGRSNVTIGGVSINNDVLSCFLRNGATLADITKEDGVTQAMLDPAVVKSPRFVWLPVVLANDRAQKGFQPIVDFVPAFITNETQTTAAVDDGSGNRNGVQINGHSVSVLRVLTFNKAALPVDEQSTTIDFDPRVGQSIVRLVG